jgi:glutamate-1-semialdehyde 2,1-aminomutase
MPYLERIRFVNTGSEADRTALRIARAVTGRIRYAKFEGGFHGSDDAFLVSTHTTEMRGDDRRPEPTPDYAGVSPRILDETLVLPYNDIEATSTLLEHHAHELAAVFMEPVAFSSGGGIPAEPEFAAAVRELTRRHGIVLVFDEVVCALRLGLAGAPAYLGVTPDLTTVGKAIGGGLPLAAVGGRRDLMEAALGADAGPRLIFQSGTFTENPLSVAAGMAVLDVLETEPALARADAAAEQIREGLGRIFQEAGLEAAITGRGSIFQVHIGATRVRNRRDVLRADRGATRRFLLGIVASGVLWPPVHPGLTSAAHTDEHIERVLVGARESLELLQ